MAFWKNIWISLVNERNSELPAHSQARAHWPQRVFFAEMGPRGFVSASAFFFRGYPIFVGWCEKRNQEEDLFAFLFFFAGGGGGEIEDTPVSLGRKMWMASSWAPCKTIDPQRGDPHTKRTHT